MRLEFKVWLSGDMCRVLKPKRGKDLESVVPRRYMGTRYAGKNLKSTCWMFVLLVHHNLYNLENV